MATLKQRLALPRNPLDWRITHLCFLVANPRVCCAKLPPPPIEFKRHDFEYCDDSVALNEGTGKTLIDKALIFWGMSIHFPLPRYDCGADADTDLAIAETPPRNPRFILADIGIVVDASLVDRPRYGNARCDQSDNWVNMAII